MPFSSLRDLLHMAIEAATKGAYETSETAFQSYLSVLVAHSATADLAAEALCVALGAVHDDRQEQES